MSTILNLTLAELAIHEPYSIAIFEKYNIDYYQKGSRTLHQACMEKGVDDLLICKEFSQHEGIEKADESRNYEDLNIEQLIEHIETRYHAKETLALSLIDSHIKFLKEQQGFMYPIMEELEALFRVMMTELKHHAAKEEKVLFPYVKKMAEMRRNKTKSLTQISLITNPLQLLEFEHEHTDSEIDTIRRITSDYCVLPTSSEEYKVLMLELLDFEKSFHKHIHLENNVLFPKIRTLESELLESIRQNHLR